MENRKLDTLVAEKVMGWIWIHSTPGHKYGDGSIVTEDKVRAWLSKVEYFDKWQEWSGLQKGDGGYPKIVSVNLPHYSTDIAAAWQVTEKINSIPMDGSEGYQIRAKFEFYIGPRLIVASAKEAAYHICLAALKAVGVDIEERQANNVSS